MNRPVRVVHVLEATEGGARKWLESVAQGLNPRMVQNACICSFRRDPGFRAVTERMCANGVPIWDISMGRAINPLADGRALLRIVRILQRHPCDVVHGHCAKGGMLARLAAHMVGVPCLYSPHAFPFLVGGSAAAVYRALERWAIRRTDLLVAVSEGEAHQALMLGYPKDRVRVVFNGVDPESELRPLQAPATQPLVGTLSALRWQKDPLTFVEACARLHRADPNIRFQLCGGGPLDSAVRRRIGQLGLAECLEMLGQVAPEAVILKDWSVFVLTSRYEGMSMALLEAMAAGVPVVATNVPGNEEVVLNERTGLLVPPEDPDALAAAVLRLLADPTLSHRLAAAAQQRVHERYARDRQLQDLTRLYREVAERHRK